MTVCLSNKEDFTMVKILSS